MTQREAVVVAARSWLGTPYHHHARVKGKGVDCGMLIIAAFYEAGLIADIDPGFYTHDWHMHRSEEKYLRTVEERLERWDDREQTLRARMASEPHWQPPIASVLVWRVGRTFSHGAIVTTWPNIVHSYWPSRLVEEVSIFGTPMAERPMRVYDFGGYQ